MANQVIERWRKFEIPGQVTIGAGQGGLLRAKVKAAASVAEIYLHGAQVTGFQKNGEPPLLFLSRGSYFTADKPIRGGVPICYPWFGTRVGEASHGYARITDWDLIETKPDSGGGVMVRFGLPNMAAKPPWSDLSAEFNVIIDETLTMELIVTNKAAKKNVSFESCLHTYFAVGDVREITITGLKSTYYLDDTDHHARKQESAEALRIVNETNRTYVDAAGPVEIYDAKLHRRIRIEKSNSASTVVWNPWTTQLLSDFVQEEYQRMICVESGNVGPNKLTLAPGRQTSLKVTLSSQAAQSVK